MSFGFPLRLAMAVLIWIGMLGLLRAGSSYPIGKAAEHSLLRLSWRLPGQKIKLCHSPSPDELSRIPLHMRRAEYCDEIYLRFELTVRSDGREILRKVVTPPGVHADRPIYVQEEIKFEPGARPLIVEFNPLLPPRDALPPSMRDTDESGLLSQAMKLRFEGDVAFERGNVRLICLDSRLRNLSECGRARAEAEPR